MRIAVTGGNGRLGTVLIDLLLRQGYTIHNLDWSPPKQPRPSGDFYHFQQIDLTQLAAVQQALAGCEAVIHLAAFPGPQFEPPGLVYTNNSIASYNILQAATALGLRKICLASSVNALGGVGSRRGHFAYFPVDENHPTYNEDDYSLAKWVMEAQADSFARRFPEATISSLRFHALPDEPPELSSVFHAPEDGSARALWGWTLISEAARACLLAIEADFHGHEVFFITAPTTASSIPSLELARHTFPEVPVQGDLSGRRSFFDCSKAVRLLGWVHP